MPYQPMTDDEVHAFLTAEPPRTAKLATVCSDGRPHVAPIWFVAEPDGTIVFNTGAGTLKGRNLQRDQRVCLCVDDEAPPFSFVMIEGTVDISEDPDELLASATKIGGRYMGADKAEAFGRRNAVPGELVIKVRPTKTVSAKNLAD